MVTGSAPVSKTVANFLKVCFCCPLIEGYGQTESVAAISKTLYAHSDSGHVGLPLPCTDIKLVDVPVMNYRTTDLPYPNGELCYRGPNCTSGYYKNPEETANLIDSNGWLHSGDIATILPGGCIKIIDRAKNIFKLSQGEYVTPEQLEIVFMQSKWIQQIFVDGNPLKSWLVAIVVLNKDILLSHLQQINHKSDDDLSAICQDEDVINLVMNDMVEIGKKNKLLGFEFPKKILLTFDPFADSTLTPTCKSNRYKLRELFKEDIIKLCAGID